MGVLIVPGQEYNPRWEKATIMKYIVEISQEEKGKKGPSFVKTSPSFASDRMAMARKGLRITVFQRYKLLAWSSSKGINNVHIPYTMRERYIYTVKKNCVDRDTSKDFVRVRFDNHCSFRIRPTQIVFILPGL